MPLSEHEQRILQEIEDQFYATDPKLAQQVAETSLPRHAWRRVVWATVGFFISFAVLIVTFTSSIWVGFLGFLSMLACTFVIQRNFRKLGRVGIDNLVSNYKETDVRGRVDGMGQRFRDRFRRDEP